MKDCGYLVQSDVSGIAFPAVMDIRYLRTCSGMKGLSVYRSALVPTKPVCEHCSVGLRQVEHPTAGSV